MAGTRQIQWSKSLSSANELAIALPDRVIQDFGLEIEDHLAISETPGGIKLKPIDTAEMRALERVMRENYDVLKQLADS